MQRVRGVGGPILLHGRIAVFSGLTTTLAAGAILFAARWATTSQLRAAIQRLKVTAQIVTPFTNAQELQVSAFLCSAFTASDTGGTPIAPPPAGQNSLLQVSESAQASAWTDLRIATAAAVTAGTRAQDALAFAGGIGAQLLAAASAAENIILLDYDTSSDQRQPVILQGGGPTSHGSSTNVPGNAQGIEIVNGILQGAAGTVRYLVEMEWLEYFADSAEVLG